MLIAGKYGLRSSGFSFNILFTNEKILLFRCSTSSCSAVTVAIIWSPMLQYAIQDCFTVQKMQL